MKESIKKFSDIIRETYKIDPSLYSKYSAKRGLRNEDGTGVLVGLTKIGNVHGYIFDEGRNKERMILWQKFPKF